MSTPLFSVLAFCASLNFFLAANLSTIQANSGWTSGYTGSVTMTSSNAIAIIDYMIALMNTSGSQILTQPDLTIFLGYDDFNALITAWRAFNGFHIQVGQEETGKQRWEFIYPGTTIRIVAVRGLNGSKKRILTNAKNLVIGNDLDVDITKFRIWFEDLSDTIFFRAKFKQGAGAYYYQNIVIYS